MGATIIRKKFGHTASILEGTDKLIASSRADWLGIKEGNFIIIGDDREYYKVVKNESFFYIKDAEIISNDELAIKESTGIKLSINDDLVITHKEYELTEVIEVSKGGSGYEKGDEVNPYGGICKYNSFDEVDIPAAFTVDEVDDSGAITSLSISNRGVYNKPPENECALTGGSGSGAKVKIETLLLEDRSMEERTITDMRIEEGRTTIKLNIQLPPRVQEAKLSVNKWQITLDRHYAKDSRLSVPYQVIKDFTPYMNMPLLSTGTVSSGPTVFNEAMAIVDLRFKEMADKYTEEIEDLQDEIKNLKNQIELLSDN